MYNILKFLKRFLWYHYFFIFLAHFGPSKHITASTTPFHESFFLASCFRSLIPRILRSSLTLVRHRVDGGLIIYRCLYRLLVVFVWFPYFNLTYCIAFQFPYVTESAHPSTFENSHYVWINKYLLIYLTGMSTL